MYKQFFSPLLFLMDAESSHRLVMKGANLSHKIGLSGIVKALYELEDPLLGQQCFGLTFKNPIGLAAGLDKNCEAQEFISSFGFGFSEAVGFAYEPQEGNPRPRIFRLVQDRALINRMGFPSFGAIQLAEKLKETKKYFKQNGKILGVNFGKSKNVPIEDAVEDYLKSFRLMQGIVDFAVINVSSPNTPGLRDLQAKERLDGILRGLQAENSGNTPILVKVAPDLTLEELDDILACAIDNNLQGIVATNTTRSREGLKSEVNEDGGLSGKPLFPKSLEFVRHIRKSSSGKLKIIGVGGISSANDAIQMFQAGADLIEMYTALVYEGPGVAYRIKQGLLDYIKLKGLSNIKELVGNTSI